MTINRRGIAFRKAGVIGAGALLMMSFIHVVPAGAVTTTVCLNSSATGSAGSGTQTCGTGGAYGTDINSNDTTTGSLDSTANGGKSTFGTSLFKVTCTSATLKGSSASNGTGGTFSSFTFGGCTDLFGNSVTITANCLSGCTSNWSATATYSGTTGQDGTLTVTAPSSTYGWKLVDANLGDTCYYAPNAAGGGSITGALWNAGNAGSPLTSGKGGVNFSGQTFNKFNGPPNSSGGCPSSGPFNAGFDLTADNSGGAILAITS